ncbi:MAG: Serine/threonine-protein kinase PknD [Chlamydiia bacterium]|nr:Serine/threonine-protein kinase PknD [Chlamydiia bacterium]
MSQPDFYNDLTCPNYGRLEKPPGLPDMIGPYKIDSLLSSGGMSLLYLASHPDDNKLIVVKVLSPNCIAHQELKQQFLKEANIIRLTDHPNIVKLYGQGEWEQGLYISMEFIRGISLKQFIISKSFSMRRSIDIVLQVAYALLHLHTHGVIHRDLKPENILITESGGIKVIDFGIAQLASDQKGGPLEQMQRLIGTPSYMSPEQKVNPSNLTYASDIYSLGIILYELITGKLTYGSISVNAIPKHLRKIVQRCLMPNPHDRYTDIVDLIHDLSGYLKQGLFNEDRSSEDAMLETWEAISSHQRNMTLPRMLSTPTLDIGLSYNEQEGPLGLFADTIKLNDGTFFVICARTHDDRLEGSLDVTFLKGMFTSLIACHGPITKTNPLTTAKIAEKLNEMLCEEPSNQQFSCTLLHLDPLENAFSMASLGFDTVWQKKQHLDSVRSQNTRNPLLGHRASIEIQTTKDNWNQGDMLIIHTYQSHTLPPEQTETIHNTTIDTISRHLNFSPKSLSDQLQKKLAGTNIPQIQNPHHLVLTIQRVE